MPQVSPNDAHFRWFYQPFVKSRKGQILIPSPKRDHVRDGIAAIHLARHFPQPAYSDLVVEPSRPMFTPGPNLIVIGRHRMLIDRSLPSVREPRPAPVDPRLLGERFDRIETEACFGFQSDPDAVLNRMTRTAYVSGLDEQGREVDYGIIRRSFLGPHENTLIFEGRHWLGTLGAVMVATNPVYLATIHKACSAIRDFDTALPIEILVRATFDLVQAGDMNDPVKTAAQPLLVVYNGRLAFDLKRGLPWIDQKPWDHVVDAWADSAMARIPAEKRITINSVLEIECDLSGTEPRMQALCREHLSDRFGKPSLPASWPAESEEIVRFLIAQADRATMTFYEMAEWGKMRPGRALPRSEKTVLRKERKRFLYALAVSWLARVRFHPDEATIRDLFPDFCAIKNRRRGGIPADFKGQINGKMRESFGPIFGHGSRRKENMAILLDGAGSNKHYRLDLKQAGIRLKLRF